jgi:chaperonin GroES
MQGGIMFEKIRPLANGVLVQRMEEIRKTESGLYIPDSAQEKAQIGKVVAIGQGRITTEGKIVPLQVKVGDVIFFGKYAGTDAGKEHLIIKEDEILGVIEQ